MRRHLPDATSFLGRAIPDLPAYTVVEHVGSGCNAHVFRAHSDDVNNDVACKVIPKANLVGKDSEPPEWRAEIDKANVLRSMAVVKFWHVSEWQDHGRDLDCVVLCSDFVPGITLEKFIKQHRKQMSMGFIELFLREMFAFLHDMVQHDVVHSDLHAKNILVEDRSDQLEGDSHAFRVTDFGVRSATSDTDLKDDYHEIAVILRELLENVDYQLASARDRFSFNVLNDHFLARHLIESDHTRDPIARRPHELHKKLLRIGSDFSAQERSQAAPQLATPFDYLNCEQIGDSHSLLKSLYSHSFLGLPEIEKSRNNLILTGPRGCGKTTVFRSLSLRHRLLVGDDDPSQLDYLGIYYRCDDLYAALPRYRLPDRTEAYDIPVHYLTATLINELLASLGMWAGRHFPQALEAHERQAANELWGAIGASPPTAPGGETFDAICHHMQKERKRGAERQRFANDPKRPMRGFWGPEVLVRVCDTLTRHFSFLRDRPVYFFIDDYSMPKITADLQGNLNRLLMQRTPHCFFKISTESPVSYCRSDIDGKAYVEGREFNLLNLGLVYLSAAESEKLRFIEDVFTRRFSSMSDYPVTSLDELVGSYVSPSYNEVALAIRQGEKPEMWGKETLCRLCSGDIFYIIRLVGRMVESAGGREGLAETEATPRMGGEVQKKAIRGEAGSFLNSVRGIEGGERLVEVVTAFGNVAYSHLKFLNSRNEKGNPPRLASRIEPYEELRLSDEAQLVYDELLRYSLFVEDPRGKSRRGRVGPRLYLRRSLLPHFNLTFSRRDSVELEAHEVEGLLLKPQEFEKAHRLKGPPKEAGANQDPRQREFFGHDLGDADDGKD